MALNDVYDSSDEELIVLRSSGSSTLSLKDHENPASDRRDDTPAVNNDSDNAAADVRPTSPPPDAKENREAELRAAERALFAERQLTATLEEALVDIEAQSEKRKFELELWKQKAVELEQQLGGSKTIPDVSDVLESSAQETALGGSEHVEAGMRCEVLTLDVSSRSSKTDAEPFALIAHRHRHNNRSLGRLESAEVQNPFLQNLLRGLFNGTATTSNDAHPSVKYLDVLQCPLLHCWDELIQARDNSQEAVSKSYINLLVDLFAPELKTALQAKQACIDSMEIPFHLVWTIFTPGSLSYCNVQPDAEGLMKVTGVQYEPQVPNGSKQGHWIIEGMMVAFDGENFGQFHTHIIVPYSPVVNLRTSEVVPLGLCTDRVLILERITERGRHLQKISKQRVCQYVGRPTGFCKEDKMYRGKTSERFLLHPGAQSTNLEEDAWMRRYRHLKPLIGQKKLGDRDVLSSEELLLTVPEVPGYLLRSRQQDMVKVADLAEVKWVRAPFVDCVLTEDTKGLLQDIVAAHTAYPDADSMPDMVKGLVIAISGAAGSGKTSLVHALAEQNQRAVLAYEPRKLNDHSFEDNLRDMINLGAATQQVVLLENMCLWLKHAAEQQWEQEMHLALLNALEHNRGVVFLTLDSGLSDLPPGLASRVDLCLDTSRLTKPTSRSEIWRSHLFNVAANEQKLTDAQIDALAEKNMSVQEIASTVKMAYLLAKRDPWDPNALYISHIQRVMKIRRQGGGKAKETKKPVTPQDTPAKSDGLGNGRKEELIPDMSVDTTATTIETGKVSKQPYDWGTWGCNKEAAQLLGVEDDVPKDQFMEEKMSGAIQAATDVVNESKKGEENKAKERSAAPATSDDWNFDPMPTKKSKVKKNKGWKGWECEIEEMEKPEVVEQQTDTDPPAAAADKFIAQPAVVDDLEDHWGDFGGKKNKKKEKKLRRSSFIAEPSDVVIEPVEEDIANQDGAVKSAKAEALTDMWGFEQDKEKNGKAKEKKSPRGFEFSSFDDLKVPDNICEPEAPSTNDDEPPKKHQSSWGNWGTTWDFGAKDQETKDEAVAVDDFDWGALSKPKKKTKKFKARPKEDPPVETPQEAPPAEDPPIMEEPTAIPKDPPSAVAEADTTDWDFWGKPSKKTKKSKAPPKEDPPAEILPEAPPAEEAPIAEEPPAVATDPPSTAAEADTPEKLKSAVDEYITEMKAKLDALGQSWTAEGRVTLNDKDTGIAKILRDIKYKTVKVRTRSTNVFEPGM